MTATNPTHEPITPPTAAAPGPMPPEAASVYGIEAWSGGYFAADPASGHLHVTPRRNRPDDRIDLYEMVRGLQERGIETPVLVRFTDLLADRIGQLRSCFDDAIAEHDYTGSYSCVYPIKVNQQRPLVETIRDFAQDAGFGLEAGSKPELLAVLGLTAEPGRESMPIVCNGFKDAEFIETVLLAAKLGRNIVPVVERFAELEMIVELAKRYGARPRIGLRMKPSTTGSGRWEDSGGNRSKFGLQIADLTRAIEYLRSHAMLDCLDLLHAHVGSQLCDIRQLKDLLGELAHTYCELRRLGAHNLKELDIGGGLGIDYDGSRSAWASSRNYSTADYAREVIYRVKAVCDDAGQPHPSIVTESGRALTAHASVLVFDVMGRTRYSDQIDMRALRASIEREREDTGEVPQPILDLFDAYDNASEPERDSSLIEAFHDASSAHDQATSLYTMGYIGLPMRTTAERVFWAVCRRVLEQCRARGVEPAGLHEDLAPLPDLLRDIYFANVSVFQSMPDHWAIDQVFPICPIHRLDETPTRWGVLADVTCDSDGQVDRFVTQDHREYKSSLELHELREGERYYLGGFLVGAYQEVLGDLHNLFGDTNVVHVSLDDHGGWSIDEVIEGDRVEDVLGYLQYNTALLRKAVRNNVERASRAGRISVPEGRALLSFYEQGLSGYTYLE